MTVEKSIGYIEIFSKDRRKDINFWTMRMRISLTVVRFDVFKRCYYLQETEKNLSNEPSMVTKLVSDGSRLAGKEMVCHDCYLPSMEVRPRVRTKNVHRKSLAVLRGFVSGDITRLIGRPGKLGLTRII